MPSAARSPFQPETGRAGSYLKSPSQQMLGPAVAGLPEHLLSKPTSPQSLSIRRSDDAEAHQQPRAVLRTRTGTRRRTQKTTGVQMFFGFLYYSLEAYHERVSDKLVVLFMSLFLYRYSDKKETNQPPYVISRGENDQHGHQGQSGLRVPAIFKLEEQQDQWADVYRACRLI